MLEHLKQNLIPENDSQRLEALMAYNILYTSAEETFDNITAIMVQVFKAPMSFISLVDQDKVFYKSQAGPFGKSHVQRKDSLCSLTILGKEPLVIEDASLESCFDDNPLVQATGGIRFYAGAPLITKSGYPIGAVCIVDTVKRSFSDQDKQLLVRFANMVMHEIELRVVAQKQTEIDEQLSASNRELQFVTETMPQLVWATEPDGHAYYFNKGWLDYTGLSIEEVMGDGWTQSLHPDDRDRTHAAWKQAVSTTQMYDVEYRLLRKDGVYRWFVARGKPMRDDNGTVLKWYGTSTDIDDQKAVQEDLKQSNERFDLVAKATQDAIWDWNLVTDDMWWNEGFKELFGYKAEEIETSIVSWYSRVHPDDTERVVGGIHQCINNGGKQWADEYRFRKRDGTYAIVFDRGYTLYDENGKPYRMLGSMQDITERKKHQQAIERSEERFEAAVAAVEGVIWTNNAQGKMEGVQTGWAALTGQTFEEYQGYGWAKAVHPDDAQPTINAWEKAVNQKKPFVFEHRLKTKEGEWRLFSINAIPLLNEDGSIREYVGVHTDITEQRQAAQKIKESEQRFQNLIAEASVGIIILTGEEMKVEMVNNAYGRLIGRTAEALQHKKLFEVIPEAEEAFRSIIDKVRLSGEPIYLYDQPYSVYNNGEKIDGFLNIVYQPYREVNGVISGVMILCQDVTNQVRARMTAQEAEERAKLAVASAELGTFDVDLHTNHIIASDRLDAIFDVQHTGERARYIDAIHPDDRPIRDKAYEAAFLSGYLEYESRIARKDGTIRWVRVKGKVNFDDHQIPVKLLGVVQDITEEKEFAHELTRQVHERTAELEQFTYVSHHDLQEPLRKISIFVDMVRNDSYDKLTESSQRRLDKVTESATRMSIALKDVLNYASLNKEENYVPTDLDDILAMVKNDLELAIVEKGANIEADNLPVIAAIPQQMHQLFYNLVNNALKFAKPDIPPHIRISCQSLTAPEVQSYTELDLNKSYYQLSVQDNGIGFNQNMADRIFGMFQRLHNRTAFAGTGIGLALCKKVVANHKGIIWATGEPGIGATFNFILPTTR